MLFAFWSKPLRPLVHTNFPSKIVLLWVSLKSKSTFQAHFSLVRRIGYRPILCLSIQAIGRYHYLKKPIWELDHVCITQPSLNIIVTHRLVTNSETVIREEKLENVGGILWWPRISSGQATINFACSCAPDHAEKEVRPDLRRHPRQAPLASSRAKDPVQDWGVGLPMSPRERSILPFGDAHCSGGCLWSSIASISCSWGLGHSPH